ncbi:hypothetical protein BC828DRAFT_377525 [Blastocladiella britannica]|nr:hypothetical protein BC828DRAFT_377525 [Blastocladiella britannica]
MSRQPAHPFDHALARFDSDPFDFGLRADQSQPLRPDRGSGSGGDQPLTSLLIQPPVAAAQTTPALSPAQSWQSELSSPTGTTMGPPFDLLPGPPLPSTPIVAAAHADEGRIVDARLVLGSTHESPKHWEMDLQERTKRLDLEFAVQCTLLLGSTYQHHDSPAARSSSASVSCEIAFVVTATADDAKRPFPVDPVLLGPGDGDKIQLGQVVMYDYTGVNPTLLKVKGTIDTAAGGYSARKSEKKLYLGVWVRNLGDQMWIMVRGLPNDITTFSNRTARRKRGHSEDVSAPPSPMVRSLRASSIAAATPTSPSQLSLIVMVDPATRHREDRMLAILWTPRRPTVIELEELKDLARQITGAGEAYQYWKLVVELHANQRQSGWADVDVVAGMDSLSGCFALMPAAMIMTSSALHLVATRGGGRAGLATRAIQAISAVSALAVPVMLCTGQNGDAEHQVPPIIAAAAALNADFVIASCYAIGADATLSTTALTPAPGSGAYGRGNLFHRVAQITPVVPAARPIAVVNWIEVVWNLLEPVANGHAAAVRAMRTTDTHGRTPMDVALWAGNQELAAWMAAKCDQLA